MPDVKFCLFFQRETLSIPVMRRVLGDTLRRLGMECLDLVQFHWWDFNVPRYIEALLELQRLRQAGKIANLAVTNFDTQHLQEVLAAGDAMPYR